MNWIDIITNAGTGGILGIGGSLATGWLKLKANKQQAEIDIEKAKLQIDSKTIEADSGDFRASQEAAAEEHKGLLGLSEMADTAGQKWALILHYIYKGSVRPTLALAIHAIAAAAYFSFDPELQQQILSQIFIMTFAYGGWYFGQRDLNKRLLTK